MLEFDVVIVGSGFGGSVSAMRLAEKGYRVAVIETGKRWRAEDFAKSNWNLRRYLWFPLLRCFGPQRITLLKHLMLLHGSGVGGGSLIYANTLMKPLPDVFQDPEWPQGVDWNRELDPHFEQARYMLGVTSNPRLFESEQAIRVLGERMGVADTFHVTEVGIHFGEAGKTVPDPYFGGKGPARGGCTYCGGCMVGCRHNAKNTLDKNYLYFAEKAGAQIFPETTVTRLVPQADGGYVVETKSSTSWWRRSGPTFRAPKVVLAAGVLGTTEILLRNRDDYGTLPKISPLLGEGVRTNGESLLAATSFRPHHNFSEGIAIGAAIHPDPVTKIEAVKYAAGSDFMRVLAVPLTPDGGIITRPLKMLRQCLYRFPRLLRLLWMGDWARSTVILLVMQSIDTRMRLGLGRSVLGFFRRGLVGGASGGKTIPSYLPIAQQAISLISAEYDAEPINLASEVLLKTPSTAHILGGCSMADGPDRGVIDARHEVFGHPGLYVCDGSVIPVNLAVNPSLTITALAERFAALFPPKNR
ncbi:MAG: GMC family oxidoreductase [Bdellovibrionales bacterium]|nr:GMC family oxidoreductase [Bdellovibrionales bacterium]